MKRILEETPACLLRAAAIGLTVTLALGACGAGEPAASSAPPPEPAAEPAAIDHRPWAEFLAGYLWPETSGVHKLEYGAVEPQDREALEEYLRSLQTIAVSDYPRDERMAFWINLYNALTVDVVLDHYPVASILDIDLTPPSDGPWDAELVRVEGRGLSLNDIEHQILRPTFEDHRVHYAVNCASYSCPNLAEKPFTPENLEELLERSARDYVNHPRGARFEGGRLVVSSLYVWYREDFGGTDRGIVEHLRKYAAGELAEKLASLSGETASGELAHDYDWSLNEP